MKQLQLHAIAVRQGRPTFPYLGKLTDEKIYPRCKFDPSLQDIDVLNRDHYLLRSHCLSGSSVCLFILEGQKWMSEEFAKISKVKMMFSARVRAIEMRVL